jgi:oxidase EvaA
MRSIDRGTATRPADVASSVADVLDWFEGRRRANTYSTRVIPLAQLSEWNIDRSTGDLVHRSGRFYTVTGLDVANASRSCAQWQQPIIRQPEIGILGILVKDIDGKPHCLLQSKMEPGNVNLLELSPTVQATKSNFTRAHGGRTVPYLEYFMDRTRGRIIFDALQSEQGSWFYAKRNRNMVVHTAVDVEAHEDFVWIPLTIIGDLLRVPNLVNMDTRTVLSGMLTLRPGDPDEVPAEDAFRASMAPVPDRAYHPRHNTADLLSALTDAKARSEMRRTLKPLAEVERWQMRDGMISHDDGLHFSILGLEVEASNREVNRWSQPMVAPRGRGIAALVGRHLDDTLHVLVNLRMEAGAFDGLELAATVHFCPDNYIGPSAVGPLPRFADVVRDVTPEQIRFDCVHSEEGGRFFQAQTRYMLLIDESLPADEPPGYLWVTPRQLASLVRFGNHVNVEARSLLACLGFLT